MIKKRVYEQFMHHIQMNREVVLNNDKVIEALDIICDWSYAHRAGNGQLSPLQTEKMIERCLKRMQEY